MIKKLIKTWGPMMCAFALLIGQQVSLYDCLGPFYQPTEPAGLKKISK